MGDSIEKMIFNKCKTNKYNVIYGWGTTSKLIADIAKKIGIEIACIVVSDGYKEIEYFNGISVCELSDFSLKNEECNILFTIKRNTEEIIQLLNEKGYFNITYINSQREYIELLNIYYDEYFKSNNINFNHKDIIQFEDFKIINPFPISKEIADVFLSEIGDLILPPIMNDYSRIDEGSYEYGNVILEADDVVIDCGANIGVFSSVAAFKGCKVYSFEPISETIKILEKSKSLYDSLIEICPFALSDKVGSTNFEICDNSNSQNKMIDSSEGSKNTVAVNMTTIDRFVEQNNIKRVDFIKADIEGAERYMLKGAKETLKRFAPKLAICTYHLKDDPKVLESIIKEANPDYIVEHRWKKLYAYVK